MDKMYDEKWKREEKKGAKIGSGEEELWSEMEYHLEITSDGEGRITKFSSSYQYPAMAAETYMYEG